jgi:hypothetical protein
VNETDEKPKRLEFVLQTPHAVIAVMGELVVAGKHDAAVPSTDTICQMLFDAERTINTHMPYLRAHINLHEVE